MPPNILFVFSSKVIISGPIELPKKLKKKERTLMCVTTLVLVILAISDHLGSGVDDFLGWALDDDVGLRRGRDTRHGREVAAGDTASTSRDGDANVLGGAGGDLGVDTGDVDALGLVLVGGRDDLDDFVAGELEDGNIHGGAVHQVGIENTKNRFVRNDEKITLLALKLQNDGLKADGEVVVGLCDISATHEQILIVRSVYLPQRGGIYDDTGRARASRPPQGRGDEWHAPTSSRRHQG